MFRKQFESLSPGKYEWPALTRRCDRADANQAFNAKQAIRLGRELGAFELSWLEDPVAYHDLRGCAEVRRALSRCRGNRRHDLLSLLRLWTSCLRQIIGVDGNTETLYPRS